MPPRDRPLPEDATTETPETTTRAELEARVLKLERAVAVLTAHTDPDGDKLTAKAVSEAMA